MEQIIPPVDKRLLLEELTPDKQLRMTNKSNNQIFVVDIHDSPNVVREIGRQREEVFREAGGGTGKALDLDEFDVMDNCYKQLIVWNPEEQEIIGGYRYKLGTEVDFDKQGQPILATSHMFKFSEKFIKEYLPQTIELARSYVTIPYQSSRRGTKSLFALDNLWDGLGALTVIMPNVKYFFGKMTMYPSYLRKGRDMILYFLNKHFGDKEHLITPMNPLKIETDIHELEAILNKDDLREDYRILNTEIRKLVSTSRHLSMRIWDSAPPCACLVQPSMMGLVTWRRPVFSSLSMKSWKKNASGISTRSSGSIPRRSSCLRVMWEN